MYEWDADAALEAMIRDSLESWIMIVCNKPNEVTITD